MSNMSKIEEVRLAAYSAVGGFNEMFSNASRSALEQLAQALDKQLGQVYSNKNEPEKSATPAKRM